MNDTLRFLNHLSNIMEAGASHLFATARYDLEDLVRFLADSDLRESEFWDRIYIDLQKVLNQLRKRPDQDGLRKAFIELSSISRRIWEETGLEPLYNNL